MEQRFHSWFIFHATIPELSSSAGLQTPEAVPISKNKQINNKGMTQFIESSIFVNLFLLVAEQCQWLFYPLPHFISHKKDSIFSILIACRSVKIPFWWLGLSQKSSFWVDLGVLIRRAWKCWQGLKSMVVVVLLRRRLRLRLFWVMPSWGNLKLFLINWLVFVFVSVFFFKFTCSKLEWLNGWIGDLVYWILMWKLNWNCLLDSAQKKLAWCIGVSLDECIP